MAGQVNPLINDKHVRIGWHWRLVFSIRLFIGGILLVAGGLKVADPAQFVTEIERYRILDFQLSWIAGHYVPWLEIATGLVLVFGAPWKWRTGAWCMALGLHAAFAVFIGSAWERELDITCGCFGGQSTSPVDGYAFARSLILLSIVAAGAWWDMRGSAETPPSPVEEKLPT